MIAVIFEAEPSGEKWTEYLDIAARLKPELSKVEGFISVERFQSISDPGKVLSLSFWKDEESIRQWRNIEIHRAAQRSGRRFIFNYYRLRIAHVVRDYDINNRKEAPEDSKQVHSK